MRAALLVLLLVVGCKGSARQRAADPAACDDALKATPAAADLGGGLTAVLDKCRPCGVSWQPLIDASAFDPEDPPTDLPKPGEVLAVMDACKVTCESDARATVSSELQDYARTPSAPWRTVADRCHGALRVDDHTLRFARGTWYALDQLARSRPELTREFPLPPLTIASTAFALPRVDGLVGGARIHVSVTDKLVFTGVLPWARISGGDLTLAPGSGSDYPGNDTPLDGLATAIGALQATVTDEPRPVLIAPKGLPLARVLEVVAKLPAPIRLAATPASRHDAPWPEPIGAIVVPFTASPGAAGVPSIDLSAAGAPIAERVASAELPAGATEVRVVLPSTAQTSDLAVTLAALGARGVALADISLAP